MSEAAVPSPAIPTTAPAGSLHCGLDVPRFYIMHFTSAIFPLTAALLLYGWRGAAVVVGVVAGALLGLAIWRRIGRLGHQMRCAEVVWFAMLLGLMLPAHLASHGPLGDGRMHPLWPLLPAWWPAARSPCSSMRRLQASTFTPFQKATRSRTISASGLGSA